MFAFRSVLKSGVVAVLVTILSACGGGSDGAPPPDGPPVISEFSADRESYFVAERAQLTARFENGAARIKPGDIAVQNGQTVQSAPLAYGSNVLELVVTNAAGTAKRTLTVNAAYRGRIRSIEAPFTRAEHEAIRLADGRVLIIGGEDATNVLPSSLWVFDPATGKFADFGASLSTGRIDFVAVPLNNGDVLIAGGTKGLIGAPSAEVIRVADRRVTPTALPMQRARVDAAATLLADGKVFISGGAALAASDTVEIYDPATGEFALLPGRLSVGRYAHTAARIDQRRVLIYGGFTIAQQVPPPEIYDLATNQSTPLSHAEPNARGNHKALRMQDGGVLIIGGEDESQFPLASVLRFNPASGAIASFANLATPRSFFALDRLADERLLVVGGLSGPSQSDVTETTETLAPDKTRRDGPAMNRARWLHTATTLADGRVLIVGGLDAVGTPIQDAEIYE